MLLPALYVRLEDSMKGASGSCDIASLAGSLTNQQVQPGTKQRLCSMGACAMAA